MSFSTVSMAIRTSSRFEALPRRLLTVVLAFNKWSPSAMVGLRLPIARRRWTIVFVARYVAAGIRAGGRAAVRGVETRFHIARSGLTRAGWGVGVLSCAKAVEQQSCMVRNFSSPYPGLLEQVPGRATEGLVSAAGKQPGRHNHPIYGQLERHIPV